MEAARQPVSHQGKEESSRKKGKVMAGAQKKNRICVLAAMEVNSSVRYQVVTRLLRG